MKIVLASDHAGVDLKNTIRDYISGKGYEVLDLGTPNAQTPVDYPVQGKAAAKSIVNGEAERGLIFCGTGVGISIAANKVKGIRCAVCSEPYSAKLSRQHNDANILSIGSRVVGVELAKMMVDEFLTTDFEGGRHAKRIEMIE